MDADAPIQVESVPLPIAGARLATAAAGIRYRNRADLVLMELAPESTTAAVFTRNRFCAAPVTVAREHLAKDRPRYLLINAGNANAGTGDEGLRAARETCRAVAAMAGCAMSQVLPFSTGVIGEDLPLLPFQRAMPGLFSGLSEDARAWEAAARAIMTTDTRPKRFGCEVELSGGLVRLSGIAKGAGMIRPDMATMLAFLATDAAVDTATLQAVLTEAVEPSFNSITVDGDTSTNDACVLVATGASGVGLCDEEDRERLGLAVGTLCFMLAREIVRDGEGATKLVELVVEQAASVADARAVAYTIAHSPLVKTALFAEDPNWGRILAAVGRAGVDLDIRRVRIYLGDVCIVRDGGRDPDYREEEGQWVMAQDEFEIRVVLGAGTAETRVLTCDLSYDYVKINAEYRS
ncbi:MAG: bifunctional glutamate N-acetyltransferase/amino-acid acetyltransferase ArgJ [Gammaproteobacteria bacterium]|nr:MAG: bifunctional glutamate N-acetyltransferase/amino-acid acetyltransferase ArgJ [Gammaproteobacteria bacterium]